MKRSVLPMPDAEDARNKGQENSWLNEKREEEVNAT